MKLTIFLIGFIIGGISIGAFFVFYTRNILEAIGKKLKQKKDVG